MLPTSGLIINWDNRNALVWKKCSPKGYLNTRPSYYFSIMSQTYPKLISAQKPIYHCCFPSMTLPLCTSLFFKLCISPDACFYFPRLISFVHFLSIFLISLGCSVLCLFLTSVSNTILFTLIWRYNCHNRFTDSFQAINNNAKWNVSEAHLSSIPLEIATCHFSFLGFSASFEVICHSSENFLTQPKTVWFCFFNHMGTRPCFSCSCLLLFYTK